MSGATEVNDGPVGDAMTPPPLSALFLIKFDQKVGWVLASFNCAEGSLVATFRAARYLGAER